MESFKFQLTDLLSLCENLANELDRDKCWFLHKNAKFDNGQKLGPILSSFRQKFIKAIKISSNGEKTVLGPTYKVGYGGSSKSAHASIKDDSRHYKFKDAKVAVNKTHIICLHILLRVHELIGAEYPQKYK